MRTCDSPDTANGEPCKNKVIQGHCHLHGGSTLRPSSAIAIHRVATGPSNGAQPSDAGTVDPAEIFNTPEDPAVIAYAAYLDEDPEDVTSAFEMEFLGEYPTVEAFYLEHPEHEKYDRIEALTDSSGTLYFFDAGEWV